MTHNVNSGFTLIELLVVISVITLLISLTLPSLVASRKSARSVLCSAQSRELASGYAAYANDYRDRIGVFSWHKGMQQLPTDAPDLLQRIDTAPDDLRIQTANFVSIVRDLEGGGGPEVMPLLRFEFFPYKYYALLNLRSYLGIARFDQVGVCTEDTERRSWKSPDAFEAARQRGVALTDPYVSTIRYRYSSSITLTAAAYQPDVGRQVFVPSASSPDSSAFGSGSAALNMGRRRFSDVAFPSQKVMIFDLFARHNTRQHRFFSELDSSQSPAFFDGSVRLVKSSEALRARHPHFPQGTSSGSPVRLIYPYRPTSMYAEPPAVDELTALDALYFYTAGGLKGVDIGSQGVDTRYMRGP